MIYENAKNIVCGLINSSYEIMQDALMSMGKKEFDKIPVIDAQTRVVAEKYAVCFTHHVNKNYNEYYIVYLIGSFLFREEKPNKL